MKKPNVQLTAWKSRSLIRGIGAVLVTWLLIIAIFAALARFNTIILLPFGMVALAAVQHRFFTIYHEGFHSTLVPSPKLGHFIAKWFAAYPSLSRYTGVRQRHIDHHSYTSTPEDPERVSHIESWRQLFRLMFPIPCALAAVFIPPSPKSAMQRSYPFSRKEIASVILTQTVIIIALGFLCHAIGGSFIWSLLFPINQLTLTSAVQTCRQWVEHHSGGVDGADARYTYVRSNFIERALFAPMNFNFHAVHHYDTKIPWFNLPLAQADIIRHGFLVVERSTYLGTLSTLKW